MFYRSRTCDWGEVDLNFSGNLKFWLKNQNHTIEERSTGTVNEVYLDFSEEQKFSNRRFYRVLSVLLKFHSSQFFNFKKKDIVHFWIEFIKKYPRITCYKTWMRKIGPKHWLAIIMSAFSQILHTRAPLWSIVWIKSCDSVSSFSCSNITKTKKFENFPKSR